MKSIRTKTLVAGLMAMFFAGNVAANDARFEQLQQWMQGHFNSSEQAKEDKEFYNIHLNMKQIWKDDKDNTWLYVEQAAEGYLDKPYRQRVYQLKQLSPSEFSSAVYTFDAPLTYAGDWKKEQPLADLSPAKITEKVGCTVFLNWDESKQAFEGATKAKDCPSKLRGASYATSEVKVTKEGIVSWDRGYDASDKQIWGAVKAGYIFKKY